MALIMNEVGTIWMSVNPASASCNRMFRWTDRIASDNGAVWLSAAFAAANGSWDASFAKAGITDANETNVEMMNRRIGIS
jgi:hypothetical protein